MLILKPQRQCIDSLNLMQKTQALFLDTMGEKVEKLPKNASFAVFATVEMGLFVLHSVHQNAS